MRQQEATRVQHDATQDNTSTTRHNKGATRDNTSTTRVQNNIKFILIYLYHRCMARYIRL